MVKHRVDVDLDPDGSLGERLGDHPGCALGGDRKVGRDQGDGHLRAFAQARQRAAAGGQGQQEAAIAAPQHGGDGDRVGGAVDRDEDRDGAGGPVRKHAASFSSAGALGGGEG